MNLVDEEDNITFALDLVDEPLNAAFKLTAELSSRNKCSKVKEIKLDRKSVV